jgi:hypothetical protein
MTIAQLAFRPGELKSGQVSKLIEIKLYKNEKC